MNDVPILSLVGLYTHFYFTPLLFKTRDFLKPERGHPLLLDTFMKFVLILFGS